MLAHIVRERETLRTVTNRATLLVVTGRLRQLARRIDLWCPCVTHLIYSSQDPGCLMTQMAV